MKLYRQQPADDVLIDYAFEKYPTCNRLILYKPNGELREVKHFDRAIGIPYTFSTDHLWALMKIDQANYERMLPADAPRDYVGA